MNHTWLNSYRWDDNFPHGTLGPKGEEKFQKEIDKIVGVEPDGTKRFKLAWGQRHEIWQQAQGRWTLLLQHAVSVDYKANASGIVVPVRKEIGVPRYILLGFTGSYTPLEYQKDRLVVEQTQMLPVSEWRFDKETGDLITEEAVETRLKAMPRVPMYRVELVFAKHVARRNEWDVMRPCCVEKAQQGENCFGVYAEPDQSDLDTIRAEMEFYRQTFKQNPTSEITQAQYQWIAKEEAERKAKEAEADAIDAEYSARHNGSLVAKAMEAAEGKRLWSLPPQK